VRGIWRAEDVSSESVTTSATPIVDRSALGRALINTVAIDGESNDKVRWPYSGSTDAFFVEFEALNGESLLESPLEGDVLWGSHKSVIRQGAVSSSTRPLWLEIVQLNLGHHDDEVSETWVDRKVKEIVQLTLILLIGKTLFVSFMIHAYTAEVSIIEPFLSSQVTLPLSLGIMVGGTLWWMRPIGLQFQLQDRGKKSMIEFMERRYSILSPRSFVFQWSSALSLISAPANF
jgi:hypothetical protein